MLPIKVPAFQKFSSTNHATVPITNIRKYPFTVASFLVCQAIRILLAIPILLCDKSLFLGNFKYYVKSTRNPINIVFLEVSSCYHEAILRGYITGKA